MFWIGALVLSNIAIRVRFILHLTIHDRILSIITAQPSSQGVLMIRDWTLYRENVLRQAGQGIIPIFGKFGEELEEITIDAIEVARQRKLTRVAFWINSFGGANHAYNAIKGAVLISGIIFTGTVFGYAHSNAFQLLQLCSHWQAVRTSSLKFHWGSYTHDNAEIAAILAGAAWPIERVKAVELEEAEFVSRRTGVSLSMLQEFALYDRTFLATEALNMNFLDELLDDLPTVASITELVS